MPISVNLEALMAKKNMSIRELSDILDIPEDKLPILMSGQAKAMRFVTMYKICVALDCNPGDFLEPVTEEEFERRKWQTTLGLKG